MTENGEVSGPDRDAGAASKEDSNSPKQNGKKGDSNDGDGEEDDPLLDEIMHDVDNFVRYNSSIEGNQPTLEEILNEGDFAENYSEDSSSTNLRTPLSYAIPAGGIDGDIGETLSVSSKGSRGTKTSRKSRDASGKVKTEHGSHLRHIILKGISAQVTSAAQRVNAGFPTCMTATKLIAVGTQNAYILVFDSNQVIKWFLGGPTVAQNNGAVSCLAITSDSSRLLAGYARGQLIEYDLVSGKVLRDLPDVHPLGSSILHVRYTDDPNTAFFADSGGSVFELNMKRGLRGAGGSARCIFSGARGEVCTMEPLRVSGLDSGHPLTEYSILGLATISKVIIVTVRPRLKVLLTTPLTGEPTSLPHISWQFVVIQGPSHLKSMDPVLTFARGNKIHFYQVSVNLSDKILFEPLQSIQVAVSILSISWLNSRCLGVFDTQEHFHIIDVRTRETLESVDLAQVELVYQTQFFKGMSTGGNVSPAFSLAGEVAVYSSSHTFTNQVLLLGKKTFHALILRSWTELLDHLIKDNKHIEALLLGMEYYEEPSRALVGLRGSKERKRSHVSLKVMGILKKFLDLSVTKNFPHEGGMATLAGYFNEVVPPCVATCIKLNKVEFLFDKVWTTFQQDPFSSAVYLESLEPYILSDQLTVIPTQIVQEFVNHYEKRGKLEALEACLCHLSVMCLDIHQVMLVCERQNLFDAYIYIHNSAIQDYITPTEKLLTKVGSAFDKEDPLSDEAIKIGNKLLVYISCCLAGRAYPFGNIPKDKVRQVKYDVYSTITLLHSRVITPESENEPPYPHLHTLLRFDTQGFLNVLSIAFEEEEFQTEMGQSQKQRLVDVLLEVMVKEETRFTPSQIGYLFTFLARQLARGDSSLTISRNLFSNVLEVLTDPNEIKNKEERQEALLDMINSAGWNIFDLQKLEDSCERAGFYRILRKIYTDRNDHSRILACFIKDNLRKQRAFSYIQNVLIDTEHHDEAARGAVVAQYVKHVVDLLDIDVRKTAMILYFHCGEVTVREVLDLLRTNSQEMFFKFLTHYLEFNDSAHQGTNTNSMRPNVARTVSNSSAGGLQLYEEYLDLMCRHDPGQVVHYLRARESLHHNQRVLQLCGEHNVLDGQVFLLETDHRYDEAFQLMHSELKKRIETFLQADNKEEKNGLPEDEAGVDEDSSNEKKRGQDREASLFNVEAGLLLVIQFSQRVSNKLNEQDRESLWCPIFDSLVSSLQKVQQLGNPELDQKWREMIRHVISSMLGHVGHKKVVSLILSNPYTGSGSWADLKQMLSELIDTFRYESQLIRSGMQLLERERGLAVVELNHLSTRGITTKKMMPPPFARQSSREGARSRRSGVMSASALSAAPQCHLCWTSLAERGWRSVVFLCRHAFHLDCLDRHAGLHVSDEGEEVWRCILCRVDSQAAPASSARHRVGNGGSQGQDKELTSDDKTKDQLSLNGERMAVADESLVKAMALWSRYNGDANYYMESGGGGSDTEQLFQSAKFRLKLKPAHRQLDDVANI